MRRLVSGLFLLLALTACQDRVVASVTRFNSLPPALGGQSFTILPQGPQVGSLEFQHAAELVASSLASYGFRPVAPNGPATDLVAVLQYGPAGARTEIVDYGPAWGPPWHGMPQYDAYTVYAQFLEVDLLDGPAWRRGERQMVFQGRAVADTGVREFNLVLPYLVRALFDHFPGVNGQTVRVIVPVR
jgi:Domain of unknown function (DUF4136)